MSLEYILSLEIQAEILKRLPLKPLIQFRCVSKPWKRLIDSRYFMAFYGVRHPQPRCLIFRRETPSHRNEHKYDTFVDEDDGLYECSSLFEEYKSPVGDLLSRYESHPCVVDSSHGLLCFKLITYDNTEMVVLWNPSIRKYVRIPVPDCPYYKFYYLDGNYNFGNYGDDDIVGFGVCPVTFDPTILKIKRKSKTEDVHGISLPWKVQVFTLSNGTWSILSTNLPRESIRLRGSQVVIDRFIYWAAFDLSEDGLFESPFLIVSFDLIAKEFKEINLTDSLTNRLCSIQSISKLHESLVLLEYHTESEEDMPICCLWMMKKHGDNRLFTKLYNINVPHATVKALLGFRKTGELILTTQQQQGYEAHVEVYDPKSQAIDDSIDDFRYICGNDYSFFMCSYMEALLLLDHLDGFMYSISI